MDIYFHNRQRRYSVDMAEFETDCRSVADALTKLFGADKKRQGEHEALCQGELSCVLVSNKRIAELNGLYRSIDKATDVLSFSLDMKDEEGWQLGELYISVERAAAQAEEYGHSLRREMAFLFAHGLLHILGFDHETPAQEKVMFGYQNKILDEVGIKR